MKYAILVLQALLLIAGITGIVVFTLFTFVTKAPWICAILAALCARVTFAYVQVLAGPDQHCNS
jgi:uncharacterized membrane protein SirB2